MKTRVDVTFNGASNFYFFNFGLESFIKYWNFQIANAGYFSQMDSKGTYVTINPSQCGVIEFREVEINE